MLWVWEMVSWETWKHVPFFKPLKQREDPKPHSLRANRERSQKTPIQSISLPFHRSFSYSLLLSGLSRVKLDDAPNHFPQANEQPTASWPEENAVFCQRYLNAQTVWAISTAVTTRSTWMRTSLYVPGRQIPPRLQKLNTKAWSTATGIFTFS